MKDLSPGQSLILLVFLGIAITGWIYGIYWKRTMTGDIFTKDEMRIIELQDRIRVLTEANAKLNGKIADLMEDGEETKPEAEAEAAPPR